MFVHKNLFKQPLAHHLGVCLIVYKEKTVERQVINSETKA